MPKKGEVSPFRGTGASSRVQTDTHTIYKDGRWWRTRKDWERHREKKREWRQKNPTERRRIGYGASSKEWLETHQFQKAGRFWRSEEEYKRRANASVDRLMKFVAEKNVITVKPNMDPALRAKVHRELGDVVAAQRDPSAVGTHQADDHVEGRRLAGAVRPK